ncbi:hypothetical protein EXIGLDRAFT_60227 [Exidia glandulosa HHB12029]|uniref:Uncharacterized protein n=1 Tax=Exidia glandulosa HHB12029 TaxID=1314781 RepID=A0A165I3U5_EXIGL|nr:hypothetical protein EXIGLDRAFT_60227 [Exidia glandulosa HHB12029]
MRGDLSSILIQSPLRPCLPSSPHRRRLGAASRPPRYVTRSSASAASLLGIGQVGPVPCAYGFALTWDGLTCARGAPIIPFALPTPRTAPVAQVTTLVAISMNRARISTVAPAPASPYCAHGSRRCVVRLSKVFLTRVYSSLLRQYQVRVLL